MYGCLSSILSHLAFSVLVSILTNSFVFGGICFFFPVIVLVVYFLFHKDEGMLFLKKVWPFLLLGGIFIILLGISIWHSNEKENNEKAMDLFYGTRSVERYLGECRNKLPEERELDRSYFTNATDEMNGMKGKKIIGNIEYGMTPRDVYDEGDSLTITQCSGFSVGKIKPTRKYRGMFTSAQKLYGIQIKYYYAWKKDKGYDEELENDLKAVIGNLSNRYGEPTVSLRNDTACHVKWNHENQVIHWYTEIDEFTMVSELYVYLPWAYKKRLNDN